MKEKYYGRKQAILIFATLLTIVSALLQTLVSGLILPLTQVVITTLYPKENEVGIIGLTAGAVPVTTSTFTGMVIDS